MLNLLLKTRGGYLGDLTTEKELKYYISRTWRAFWSMVISSLVTIVLSTFFFTGYKQIFPQSIPFALLLCLTVVANLYYCLVMWRDVKNAQAKLAEKPMPYALAGQYKHEAAILHSTFLVLNLPYVLIAFFSDDDYTISEICKWVTIVLFVQAARYEYMEYKFELRRVNRKL